MIQLLNGKDIIYESDSELNEIIYISSNLTSWLYGNNVTEIAEMQIEAYYKCI